MEFRDIVKRYWEERRLFAVIMACAFFLAFVWQMSQPMHYRAALLLNVGRKGEQAISGDEYAYDSFYRLQADERFGDTVVRWLQSPRVVSDILTESGLDSALYSERALKRLISAKRLSSQVIELSFENREQAVLEREADAIVKVLNVYTDNLNQGEANKGWFVVVGSEPVLSDARVTWLSAALVGVFAGGFVGLWGIAILISWKAPEERHKRERRV